MRTYSSERSRDCTHLRAIPYLAVLSAALLIATIPVWFIFCSSAAESTKDVLYQAERDLQAPDINALLSQASSIALTTLYTTRDAALGLLSAGLAVLLFVVGMDWHNRTRRTRAGACGAGSYVASSATGTVLMWAGMLLVVLLVALCTAWFLGAWAGASVLQRVSQVSSDAEQAAARAVDSASSLVETVKAAQLSALDTAPRSVKETQWYKDFRSSIENLDTSVLGETGGPQNECKPGCISLGLLAGLAGLPDNCVCITNTLTQLQQGLSKTYQSLLPAIIGLLCCYLAASWLLMYCTSCYTTAKRHAADVRCSASGACPYKHCPSSNHLSCDAAIDIQNSGGGPAKSVTGGGLAKASPNSSQGGRSSPAIPAEYHTGYPASQPSVALPHGYSQSSDIELFSPGSRSHLIYGPRPTDERGGADLRNSSSSSSSWLQQQLSAPLPPTGLQQGPHQLGRGYDRSRQSAPSGTDLARSTGGDFSCDACCAE